VWLYLVHHGEATSPDEDARRPLTALGRRSVERLAAEAHARGARPAVIWHSGKLRARQTADAFWRSCNPFASLAAMRGLQPADPPQWLHDRLSGETRDVMCVGHLPHLARLLAAITRADHADGTWPPHGLVALESDAADPTLWHERWRLSPESPG
jgi:phosphohistidine phosphatase